MYFNERAWAECQDNGHIVKEAMTKLLKIYQKLYKEYGISRIYVYSGLDKELKSLKYPLQKWLFDTDMNERNLFRMMWERRVTFEQEDEIEFIYKNEALYSGTEAYMNESCVISVLFDSNWKLNCLDGEIVSLSDENTEASVINITDVEQLKNIIPILKKEKETVLIYTYEELWNRREELFPFLDFCPSVEKDMNGLQRNYLGQVYRKLSELNEYCKNYGGELFDKDLLTKTTPESEKTMQQYEKEHTFTDCKGITHVVTWHMRFTGIPGRIFFELPDKDGRILVCYIGKKLPNAEYPT